MSGFLEKRNGVGLQCMHCGNNLCTRRQAEGKWLGGKQQEGEAMCLQQNAVSDYVGKVKGGYRCNCFLHAAKRSFDRRICILYKCMYGGNTGNHLGHGSVGICL